MVEEDFFMKNYKKSEIRGHFEFFFYLEKKVTHYKILLIIKCFRAFSL